MQYRYVGCLLTAIFIAGCGGSDYKTATVSGRVTCNGKPLTYGIVNFKPLPGAGRDAQQPGKSGAGNIDATGNYVISTYGDKDGAVIGKHQVMVFPPDEKHPLPCGPHAGKEVEVIAGENVFDIEITEGKAAVK